MPEITTNLITWRLYRYDRAKESDGYRGADYSAYLLQGASVTEMADNTLDTAKVTLVNTNIARAFPPKTKFILEQWQNGVKMKYWHMLVSVDAVKQPILADDTLFDHEIDFIEALADAQGRLCRDFSVKYKLKDVSLKKLPPYDQNARAKFNRNDNIPSDSLECGNYSWGIFGAGRGTKYKRKYVWSINGTSLGQDGLLLNAIKKYVEIEPPNTAATLTVNLPMLLLSSQQSNGSWVDNGYLSYWFDVIENDGSSNATMLVHQEIIPQAGSVEGFWNTDYFPENNNDFNQGASSPMAYKSGQLFYQWYKFFHFNMDYDKSMRYGVEKFRPETLPASRPLSVTFPIRAGSSYLIKCYNANENTTYADTGFMDIVVYENEYIRDRVTTSASYPRIEVEFSAVIKGESSEFYLKSAPGANALQLFKKACISTQAYKKISGISCDDTPTAYYLDDYWVSLLNSTQITEQIYHQKNLCEVLFEIGNYIHAVPYAEFGADDRFIVMFRRLGDTDQKTELGIRTSIYNSHGIEDYVGSLTSYVSNLVQLGGEISEWVAPKTLSEDYLVYNDEACIEVSSPIMELLSVDAKNIATGETVSLTATGNPNGTANGYIFEKVVYDTLGVIDGVGGEVPNKGTTLYYELGTNQIKGLNYRLPVVNTGESDYAFKAVIGGAFGITETEQSKIKINDYVFRVVYRTKTESKVEQFRPDIRKYLLASKYDTYPQYSQFNNQQDILVDSERFGSNIYGRLIRSGNMNYRMTEWSDDIGSIKNAGELYKIDGQLTYVAQVRHTFYATHIISEIEFSKDFNRLSQIIGIPSEPRFYEITERSTTRSVQSFNVFLIVGSYQDFVKEPPAADTVVNTYAEWTNITNLLFRTAAFPKYADVTFYSDIDKAYTEAGNGEWSVRGLLSLFCTNVNNTLNMYWECKDNFSMGDQTVFGTVDNNPDNKQNYDQNAYNKLQAVRYTDVYGRADLLKFSIVKDIAPVVSADNNQVWKLPENDGTIPNTGVFMDGYSDGYVNLKDNGEQTAGSVNISLITASDRFVIGNSVWKQNKTTPIWVGLNKEVNKMDDKISIYDVIYSTTFVYPVYAGDYMYFVPGYDSMEQVAQTAAYAIVEPLGAGADYYNLIIARNVSDLFDGEKIDMWKIYNKRFTD
jgi:hypothetical protein